MIVALLYREAPAMEVLGVYESSTAAMRAASRAEDGRELEWRHRSGLWQSGLWRIWQTTVKGENDG